MQKCEIYFAIYRNSVIFAIQTTKQIIIMGTIIDTSNLLAEIRKYSRKKEEEEIRKIKADFDSKRAKIKSISDICPDVVSLLEVASALIGNKIPFDRFITEGIEHNLGFFTVNSWKDGSVYTTDVLGFGVCGGGACRGSVMITKDKWLIYVPEETNPIDYLNFDKTVKMPAPREYCVDLKFRRALDINSMSTLCKLEYDFWNKINKINSKFEQFKSDFMDFINTLNK